MSSPHLPLCRVVAEIAQAHDGSLGTAHAFIDLAAEAGAWAVKFQAHLAAAESTSEEPWRVPFSRQDNSRYDYWKRMEFSADQWAGLKAHASERNLSFIVSPFSCEAVDLIAPLGVDAWKVASGEVGHRRLIDRILVEKVPVFISSGMSGWEEMETLVELILSHSREFALFQCDTAYPSPPASWGLNVLGEMSKRFGCPVGLSDHSGDIYAGLAAASLGAAFIEIHLALNKGAFGPDVSSSVTPEQLTRLVEGTRQISLALQNPVDKNARAETLAPVRAKFGRSAALKHPLPRGSILRAEDLSLKKPAGGFAESDMPRLVGRKLATDLEANVLLRENHLESL